MAKTSRVEYLIQRITDGELTDDELAEVQDIIMGRPTDYTPIIPGTDYDPIPDADYRAATPKTASPLIRSDLSDAGSVEAPREDPRVAQLEATVIDLVRRLKALEDRVIGEKQ